MEDITMNTRRRIGFFAVAFLGMPLAVFAGVAETSAGASSNGRGPGTATASAAYNGDGIGAARTSTHSGKLNIARGLAVGLDEDGLSITHSYALAGKRGKAVGGTLNLHVGRDGETSLSTGSVTASGDRNRAVNVGGAAGSAYRRPIATAQASGSTGSRGRVHAVTNSKTSRNRGRAIDRPVSRGVMRRSRLR